MLRASVEAVEVCTSSGLISRTGGTNRQHFGRRERKRNSGCSRMDGTGIQDPRATGKRDCGRGGWGKTGQKRRVAVAVNCCLEMALWRTLWMAGQVSRMASGGGGGGGGWGEGGGKEEGGECISIFHEADDELFGVGSRAVS